MESLEVSTLVEMFKQVKWHWGLGLGEGVVTFVETECIGLNVSFRGQAKWLSPEAVSLAVRERKDVIFASEAVELEVGHF